MPGGIRARRVPVLSDGLVTLRGLNAGDRPAVVALILDPLNQRWTQSTPPAEARDRVAALFEREESGWAGGERWQWVVEAHGRTAGLIALALRDDGAREVSYAAHPDSRGRGFLTRAVRLVCGYAFDDDCPLVRWQAEPGNLASRRVAWKTGFTIAETPVRVSRHGETRWQWTGTLAPGEPMHPQRPWPRPAVLDASGLRLRPFTPDDGALLPPVRDPDCERWMGPAVPTPTSYDDWWRQRTGRIALGELVMWAVTDRGTGELLGGVQLSRMGVPTSPRSAALAYWLVPGARGAGVARRAVERVLEQAFRTEEDGGLGLVRVVAEVATLNVPSLKLLRRQGFREVGTVRQSVIGPPDQPPDDAVLFELLATDDPATQRVEPLEVPGLTTARLRLRPWRDDDTPGPTEGPDDDSRRFMPAGVHPGADDFAAWLARQRYRMALGDLVCWCVADIVTDAALGCVLLFRLGPAQDRFQGELGYWLHPPARGRGYLGEVLPAVLDHAFAPVSADGLGLTRVYAEIDPDNIASQTVLERAGFQHTGSQRQAYRNHDGTLGDGASFELLVGDDRTDPQLPGRSPIAPVSLAGEGVRLRPLHDDDATRVVEACQDPRTRLWLAGLPDPYEDTDALEYIARTRAQLANGRGVTCAVADPADDRFLGVVALMGLTGQPALRAEVGYWTHPDSRGRGLMTEAVRRVNAYAFASEDEGGLGLRRLVLRVAAGNSASRRVASVCGFVETGRQRQAELLGDGTWVDLVDYDLLATDLA